MFDQLVDHHAATIRQFNRFYIKTIGVLNEDYLGSTYPLTALRVLYEIGAGAQVTAADLARDLHLDQGGLGRLLNRLRRDGVIAGHAGEPGRDAGVLRLTSRGQSIVDAAAERSQHEIGGLLASLPEPDQRRLVISLQTAASLLSAPATSSPPAVVLRSPEPGDMGWIVQTNGVVYAKEYGFDHRVEALAAELVASFLHTNDPAWERCWIAERNGVRVGSVFVIKENDGTAKLRNLMVDPEARGIGLGRLLVRECIRFARAVGYRRLTLWTVDVLTTARHIYRSEGFRLMTQAPTTEFGPEVISETWELDL